MHYIICIGLIIASACTSCLQSSKSVSNQPATLKDSFENLISKILIDDSSALMGSLKDYNFDVNLTEPDSNQTLLIYAVKHNKLKSALALLNHGANPNHICKSMDGSALILAAGITDSMMLKLLLQNDADPNLINPNQDVFSANALTSAIRSGSMSNFKMLLKYKADLYKEYQYHGFTVNAFKVIFQEKQVEMLQYLIFNHLVDPKQPYGKRADGTSIFIVEGLRNWLFPLNSIEYQLKLSIIEELQKQKIDYRKTEVPIEFRDNHSKEYLEKY